MKITIGFTRSNRTRGDDDYIRSCDGWRAGATQDQLSLDVPPSVIMDLAPMQVADAVFAATNAPSREEIAAYPGAQQVYDALLALATAAPSSVPVFRSLSIGDTVEVAGRILACVAIGWRDVTDGSDAPAYDETPVAETKLDPEIRALLKEV